MHCQKIVMESLRVSATGQLLPILMVGFGEGSGGVGAEGWGSQKFAKTGGCFFQIFRIGKKIPVFWLKTPSKKKTTTGIYTQRNLKLNWQQIYSKQTSVNGVRRPEGGGLWRIYN